MIASNGPTEPVCPTCGCAMKRHGDELASHCGRCFGWNHAERRWVRLSSLFTGRRLKPPKPKRPTRRQTERWLHR